MLLEISELHVHYHKVAALKGVDMPVPDGGIVTIIGANGAGKSTTLRAISGLRAGSARARSCFAGERIDRLAAGEDRRRSASPMCPRAAACFPT